MTVWSERRNGMDTTTFGSRLKTLRKARGLRQRTVADAIGVATSSYALYENDRRHPDQEKTKLICQVLRCDPNYLLSENLASSSDNTANVMLFNMEDLADGDIVVGKSIGSFALPKAPFGSPYLFAVEITDNSMLGCSLQIGDYAVFTPAPAPENNKVYLISVNGKALIRRVELDPNGNLSALVPMNDVYRPFKVQPRDEIRIVGLLVSCISMKN